MKKITFNLPVRLFLDSQKTVTKYEHTNLDRLNRLNEDELFEAIGLFAFDELDERFAAFETVFYLVHLEVTFDDDGYAILSELHNIEHLYGKTIDQVKSMLA